MQSFDSRERYQHLALKQLHAYQDRLAIQHKECMTLTRKSRQEMALIASLNRACEQRGEVRKYIADAED